VRRALLLLVLLSAPAAVRAQSSQFGVRGLGMPGRPLSVAAFSTGGAFALFDAQSSVNPAALGQLSAITAGFNILQDFRHVENDAGSQSVRETRFPRFMVGGPLRKYPAVVGVSFSNYTSRDFTLATADTIILRGVLVPVSDTLSSRGGVSDLRLAGAYRLGSAWTVGAAFHVITGSDRLRSRRVFADTTYLPATQSTELSYGGVGVSVGLVRDFGANFSVAAIARSDGHVTIDRDSTARVAQVDLPYTFGLGLRWRARPKLQLASQVQVKTWSGANSDLLSQGGTGADNTVEVSLGGEYTSDLRRPTRRPIRFGVRYATLPFLLVPGDQPHEFAVSLGTGLRFAQERAGVDLGLEHAWRSSAGFRERTLLVNFGIMVRP
jgi:hypothetical protein